MKVGDLVQTVTRPEGWSGQETIFPGLSGIVVVDHSPMRPPDVGRVVDVLWSNGRLEDMYSDDLEIIDEARV
jgi:hypothetical protein